MRVQRRWWVSTVALGAAVASIVLVWNHTDFAAHEVGRRFTENLLFERGYRLDMAAVRGAPFGELVLYQPRIVAIAAPHDTLLRADAVRVRVRSWRRLLRGRVAIGRLRIERATLDWPATWPARRPLPAGAADGAATTRFPRLDLDAVEIIGATVRRHGVATPLADAVDALVQVRSRRQRVEIDIDHGRFDLPGDSLRVESMRAEAVWAGDSLVVSDLDVATVGSQVVGRATVWPRARRGEMTLELDDVDLAELGRMVPVLRRTGAASGDLRIDWQSPRTRLHGRLAGRVDTWSVPEVTFDVEIDPTGVQIEHASGTVAGTPMDLAVDLRRGQMNGYAEFSDLDLHAFVPERVAKLPPHRLAGRVTFTRPSATDSLAVDLQLRASRMGRLPIDRAVGRVTWRNGAARVHAGRIDTPFGSLDVDGAASADDIDAEFTLDASDVSGALAVWGQQGPEGDLQAHGRIEGALAAPRLEAEAAFAKWLWGGVTLRNGTLGVWGHDVRELRGDVELRADSLRIAGRVLEDLGADLEIDAQTVRIVRAQASRGDTLIAAAATYAPMSVDWTGLRARTQRVRLETVLVRLGTQELRVEEPANVWWRDALVHVDSLRVVTRGGEGRLDGTLDRHARTLSMRAEAAGVDLAFVAEMLPARPPLAGRAWGHLSADGSWDATRIDGAVHVERGHWAELAVDSLSIVLASQPQGVEAGDIRMATPHGDIQGRIRLGRLPAVARLWNRKPAAARTELATAPVEGTLHLENLDIARFIARGDRNAMPRFGARITADVTVAGDLGRPQLRARGRGEDVYIGPREIGSVDFDAEYASERVTLREGQVHNEDQLLRVRGEIPARIDLTRGVQLLREEPITAELVLPRSSFALVQRFVPLFEPALPGMSPGEVEAELEVSGTLAVPRVSGDFRVYDASFTLRNMEEVYRDVDATGRFEGTTLRVTEVTGRTGRDGTVTGSGTLELDGTVVTRYDYAFDLAHVPVYSFPEVTATVNGKLTIESVRVASDVAVVPRIRGTLDVEDALITQEFSSGAEGELFDTDTPEWLSDVKLRATDGSVRLRNSQVEADLSGSLDIVRTRQQLDLIGEVTVRRGRYLDLVNYFRITGGRLEFGANPGFNPTLDIEGETGRPGNRIYVHLSGTALEPQLSFRAEQEGVEGVAQIEEQVIGRIGSGGAVASNAVATVGGGLLRELEFLRGQNISVDPAGEDPLADPGDTSNEFGVNLSTGFAISDNAYLVYTQGVKSDIQQKAAVEIGLRRWPLLLEAAYERRNLSEGGPDQSQNAFDVNLKYRHEY